MGTSWVVEMIAWPHGCRVIRPRGSREELRAFHLQMVLDGLDIGTYLNFWAYIYIT